MVLKILRSKDTSFTEVLLGVVSRNVTSKCPKVSMLQKFIKVNFLDNNVKL